MERGRNAEIARPANGDLRAGGVGGACPPRSICSAASVAPAESVTPVETGCASDCDRCVACAGRDIVPNCDAAGVLNINGSASCAIAPPASLKPTPVESKSPPESVTPALIPTLRVAFKSREWAESVLLITMSRVAVSVQSSLVVIVLLSKMSRLAPVVFRSTVWADPAAVVTLLTRKTELASSTNVTRRSGCIQCDGARAQGDAEGCACPAYSIAAREGNVARAAADIDMVRSFQPR